MAQKRMFDRAIIDTDKFMDLPMSGKAIYFLLGMEADDEGFVSYKKVLRIHGGNEDDVKVLVAKGFLIMFPSGVVVVTDWNKNNWLDNRRTRPTEYQTEKSLLTLTEEKMYVLSDGLASAVPVERRIEEKSIVEKYGELKNVQLTEDEITKLRSKYGKSATNHLIEELSTYMGASGKKYRSHYATILNWARRKGTEEVKVKAPVVVEVVTPEQAQVNKTKLEEVRKAMPFLR